MNLAVAGAAKKLADTFGAGLSLHSEIDHLNESCQHNTEILVRYKMRKLDQEHRGCTRYHAAEVRDALLDVRDKATYPVMKIEAHSLADVTKSLQSLSMQLIVAVDLLCKTEASLVSYRDTGPALPKEELPKRCGSTKQHPELWWKVRPGVSQYVGGPKNRRHSSRDSRCCRKELLQIKAA